MLCMCCNSGQTPVFSLCTTILRLWMTDKNFCTLGMANNVSMLHQNDGGILGNPSPTPERFPKTRGRSPREILRPQGMCVPIPPECWWCMDIHSSIFLQGVDQEILTCGQGRIDGIKINPSLLMREWVMYPPSWPILWIILYSLCSMGDAFKTDEAQIWPGQDFGSESCTALIGIVFPHCRHSASKAFSFSCYSEHFSSCFSIAERDDWIRENW